MWSQDFTVWSVFEAVHFWALGWSGSDSLLTSAWLEDLW